MRKYYWYFSGYAKKHGWKILISLIIGIAIFSFVVPLILNPAHIKTKNYIGMIGEYTPSTLPQEIQTQLSIGLTKIADDGSAKPGLAEKWTIEQDNQVYRFNIPKDSRWQDGQIITPDEIQYSFPDVQIITTPNDILFKLPAPYAPFPTQVSKPIFKSGSLKKNFFKELPVLIGIGEHWISDYQTAGSRLHKLIVENDKEVFVYRFYKTEDEAINAFKRGEIDHIPDLVRTHDVMTWPMVKTESEVDFWNFLAIYFNTRDSRLTKNVRQAFSYALEKDQTEKRSIGPISPNSWAFLPGGKTYDKDWERGIERLLDELPGEPLEFSLSTTSVHSSTASKIKTELESFGQEAFAKCTEEKSGPEAELCNNLKIQISIRISNFPDLNSFDLLLIGTPIPPDPDQYAFWHSNQSTNFTGYKNTRIDNILEKARQTTDQSERKELYQEFQQFLQEDPPAIFLEHITKYSITRINPIFMVFQRMISGDNQTQ